jgi:hypothetical protein
VVGVGFVGGGCVLGVTVTRGCLTMDICRHDGWGGESETDETEGECLIDFHDLYWFDFVSIYFGCSAAERERAMIFCFE